MRDGFRAYYMPRSEDASGPYVSLASFEARYVRLQNIDTLALSEDFRLGYTVIATARYATPYLGLSSHFLELATSFSYRHYIGDDLLTYSFTLSGRLQSGVYPQPPDTPLMTTSTPCARGSRSSCRNRASSCSWASPVFWPISIL